MEQMELIRDQQESLAKLHFELGAKHDLTSAPWSEDGTRLANENMDRLMNDLEKLSVAIGKLNPSSLTGGDEGEDEVEEVVFSISDQPLRKAGTKVDET